MERDGDGGRHATVVRGEAMLVREEVEGDRLVFCDGGH